MEAEEREASEERETFSSRHQTTRGDGGKRDGETVRERAGELEMERAHVRVSEGEREREKGRDREGFVLGIARQGRDRHNESSMTAVNDVIYPSRRSLFCF